MKKKLLFALIAVFLIPPILVWLSLPTKKDFKDCFTTKHFQVQVCPGGKNFVSLAKISRYLQSAVVAAEDSRFWEHKGVDWVEIEKSFHLNLEKGRMARGASTISQQLAKNLYLSFHKSLLRKGHELILTWQLERILSKKEILELYLNVVEFGDKIYGVKAASRFYFKKSPQEIGPLESAFLAAILPNPKKYSTSRNRAELSPFLSRRIRKILLLMRLDGVISVAQYQELRIQAPYLFRPENQPITTPEPLMEPSESDEVIDLNLIEDPTLEAEEPTSTE